MPQHPWSPSRPGPGRVLLLQEDTHCWTVAARAGGGSNNKNKNKKVDPAAPELPRKLKESGPGEEAASALWLGGCKPGSGWADQRPVDHRASAAAAAAASLPSDHAHAHAHAQAAEQLRLSPDLAVVRALCEQGQVTRAVEALEDLLVRAADCDSNNGIDKRRLVYAVLKACAARKDLALGARVHAVAVEAGLGSDTFLCNHIIRMYTAHGRLDAAMAVFRDLPAPDAFTWSAVISAHVRHGRPDRAVQLYQHMRRRSRTAQADAHVLVAALRACAAAGDLRAGREVHADACAGGMQRHRFVGSSLVDMFAKCGNLQDARAVFDGLPDKDVVTWNAMVAGYARAEPREALALYAAMTVAEEEESSSGSGSGSGGGVVAPDAVTLVCVLQACANVGAPALQVGKQIYSRLLLVKDKEDRPRLESCDVVVAGSLVKMFLKCGSLADARLAFDALGTRHKDVVTWNALIGGYAAARQQRQQEEEGGSAAAAAAAAQEAIRLYAAMTRTDDGQGGGGGGGGGTSVVPNAVTFVCVLQACANVGAAALETGVRLHAQLEERGLLVDPDVAVDVGSRLVNMYVKCGSVQDARAVFDGLPDKTVVAWNSMIAGYAYQQPPAPAPAQQQEEEEEESGTVVGYHRRHHRHHHHQLQLQLQEALSLFGAMPRDGAAAPNAVTLVCLLQACASVGAPALQVGKRLHSQLQERGLVVDVVVGGSLVNMYVKCGSLKAARTVFDGLGEEKKNVVTWTAMIAGYAAAAQQQQQEEGGTHMMMTMTGWQQQQEAVKLYRSMRRRQQEDGGSSASASAAAAPDAVTYACLLDACASVGAVQQGRQLHAEVRDAGLESHLLVGTSLVKMYARCGYPMTVARAAFDRLVNKDLVAWTALLSGYAQHGQGIEAVRCFEEMLLVLVPDGVAYTALLTACSHAGLVEQGQRYFCTMLDRHGVRPDAKLYCCLVDLLARSGYLARAELVLQLLLSVTPTAAAAAAVVGWTALLSACKSYGDAETGRRCFHRLVGMDPAAATAYVVLGGIYANAGRWDEVERVERMRKAAGARKVPARACIEVDQQVREFRVGEASAADGGGGGGGGAAAAAAAAAAVVRQMKARLKEGGHVPHTQLVVSVSSSSEQDREDALCGHAEKLALAYGLLHTPAGSTLVVTKNLRMCGDCHSSTKVLSRMEEREIVVRDGHKVHRFRDGACSCQDRP